LLPVIAVPSFLDSSRAGAAEANDAAAALDWPSPDGRYAFRTSSAGDSRAIDLVERGSGRQLQRIAEEDTSLAAWHVLWMADSSGFALMTRLGHPIQGVDVYFRSGDSFRKIALPRLPDANIPDEMRHGRKYPHVASLNWQEATRWEKDGSLVVTINTMIDGDGGSITASRTVVLRFDRAGKAEIVTSTIKYESEDE
jgi:hypothetical protein